VRKSFRKISHVRVECPIVMTMGILVLIFFTTTGFSFSACYGRNESKSEA
jgi:hypothetical protein